jgi:hypothetical protein
MGRMPQLLGEPAPRLLDVSRLVDRHQLSLGFCRIENRNPGPCIPPNPLSVPPNAALSGNLRPGGIASEESTFACVNSNSVL